MRGYRTRGSVTERITGMVIPFQTETSVMHIITIAGAKGGTGKTTTALALAYELASETCRVAIADCDPQASLTQALGQVVSSAPLSSSPVDVSFLARPETRGGECGSRLSLYPGGRTLASATHEQVQECLRVRSQSCDVLIVDTCPGVVPITLAAIGVADLVLVPLQPAALPLSGLSDVVRIAARVNPGARRRAVLTLVKSRRAMTTLIERQVHNIHAGLLYPVHIPDDARCEWAATMQEPVGRYAPRCASAEAYRTLARFVKHDLDARLMRALAFLSAPAVATEVSNGAR